MIPLAIKAVCPDCGFIYRYVEDYDTHDLRCPGPIRLVFVDDGDPIAEVGSE
jgi:hypothetical protein